MREKDIKQVDLREVVSGYLKDLRKEADLIWKDGSRDRTKKSVHRIRVLSRRLDALLGTVGKERRLNKILKKNRELRKRLARIRELDVHGETWADLSSGKSYFKPVLETIQNERKKRLQGLTKKFEWKAFRKAAKKAEKKVFQSTSLSAEVRARALEAQLAEGLKRILHRPKDLHRFRIDVKRVRYGFEGLATALGSAAGVDLSWFKEMQTELGRIHDDVMLRDFLRQLARDPAGRWDRVTAAGVEKARDELKSRVQKATRAWESRWSERRRHLAALADFVREDTLR